MSHLHARRAEAAGETLGVAPLFTAEGTAIPGRRLPEGELARRRRRWLVPAYTFPEKRTDLSVLRVVVRRGFTHDMASPLLDHLRHQLPRLANQPAPIHDASAGSGFRH